MKSNPVYLFIILLIFLGSCGKEGDTYITNVDSKPMITMLAASVNEGDIGSNPELVFTLNLSWALAEDVTVDYTTSDGSAIAGEDYVSSGGTLLIPAGNASGTISIPVIGDNHMEQDETLNLNVTGISSNSKIGIAAAVGTIISDDLPQLYIQWRPALTEGDAGTTDYEYLVQMMTGGEISWDVYVDINVINDTATAGVDFTVTTGTYTIPAGETSLIVPVSVIGDIEAERNETFILTLSNPVGATIIDSDLTGTIINDDNVTVDIADTSVNESYCDSSDLVFTVSLDGVLSQDVMVDYVATDGNALEGYDYTGTSGTLLIPAGDSSATIPVNISCDTFFEADETLNLTLSNPLLDPFSTTAGAVLGTATATGTITNDDGGAPVVNIEDASMNEGDTGDMVLSFSVRLSAPLGTDVTFDFETADNTAESYVDYIPQDTTHIIPSGETLANINVVVSGDTGIEYDEVFYLTITGVSPNAVLGNDLAIGTIINDDHLTLINDDSFGSPGIKSMIFNDEGNGLAVWEMSSGNRYRLYYSYYNAAAKTWTVESELPSTVEFNQRVPAVASNGKNFMVLWRDHGIRALSFDGSTWGSEANLSTGLDEDLAAPVPLIASNGDGYAAAWLNKDGMVRSLYASISKENIWGETVRIENDTNEVYEPAIASDGSNYAAAWRKYSETTFYPIVSSFYDGAEWGDEVAVGSAHYVDAGIKITSNATNYAVVWRNNSTLLVRLSTDTSWGPATNLTSGICTYFPSHPDIASNGSGYAVVWQNGGTIVCENIYEDGNWQLESELISGILNSNQLLDAAIASNGDGYAVSWLDTSSVDGLDHVVVNNYKDSNWEYVYPQDWLPVDAGSDYNASIPKITSAGEGYAVYWQQSDGFRENVFNVFADSSLNWGAPAALTQNPVPSGIESNVKLAVNNAGEILAVWRQSGIYARLFKDGSWGDTFQVSATGGQPDVDSNGTDFLISYFDTGSGLFAVEYNSTTGPGSVETLTTDTIVTYSSRIASNGSGYTVIWITTDNNLYANVYNGSSWSGTDALEISSSSVMLDLDIVSNGTGYAVVWKQNNGIYSTIYSGNLWQDQPSTISGNWLGNGYHPRIASNGSNYAVAYARQEPTLGSIYFRRSDDYYWYPEQAVEISNGQANKPDIASNGNGYTVIWRQSDTGSIYNLYANIFDGSSWEGTTLLESGPGTVSYNYEPRIMSNGSGYAAAWIQDDGSVASLYASVFDGISWQGGQLLENGSNGFPFYFEIDLITRGGEYVAGWTQVNEIDNLLYDGWVYIGLK